MCPWPPKPPRPLRADAERNRQRILDAAAASCSPSADWTSRSTTSPITRAWASAPSTGASRTRTTLIDALFEQRSRRIVEIADAAAAHEDAWAGLVYWITNIVERQVRDRGLKAIMTSSSRGKKRVAAGRAQIGPRIGPLVPRAQEQGTLRADVAISDIPMLVFMIVGVAEYTSSVDPDIWRRYLAIVLDGLRADSKLPHPALDFAQMAKAMDNWR